MAPYAMYQATSSIMQNVARRICVARRLYSQMSRKVSVLAMTSMPIRTGQNEKRCFPSDTSQRLYMETCSMPSASVKCAIGVQRQTIRSAKAANK